MFHEAKRLPFTKNALYSLVTYYIVNKNTKEFDPKRCHFIGEMFPEMSDLGSFLNKFGKRISKNNLKKEVKKYTDEAFMKVVKHYVEKSNKVNCLDANYECHTTNDKGKPDLFFYYGSLSFLDEELDTLRAQLQKRYKRSDKKFIDKKVRDEMLKVTKYFHTQMYGDIDIEDVKGFYNFHLDGNHDHLHYVVPAFNPKTGLFLNPKSYAFAKQQAHIKTEIKFPWLIQGIAEGLSPEIIQMKKQSLKDIQSSIKGTAQDHIKMQQAEEIYNKSLKKIEKEIIAKGKIAGLSYSDYVSEMAKNNIKVELGIEKYKERTKYRNSSIEQFLVFTDEETGAVITNPFLSKAAVKNVQRVANRHLNDRRLASLYGNKWKEHSYDRIETVLLDTLNSSIASMNRKLAQKHLQASPTDSEIVKLSKSEEIQTIKNEAFKEFCDVSLRKGILVNINKQKHLSYHKINASWKDNVEFQAESYKSSNFVIDLQGKTIAEIMSLPPEIIQAQQETIMQYLSSGHQNHRNVWLKNGSIANNQFNHSDQEFFQSEYHKKLLEKNQWELQYNEQNNATWIVDKTTGEGLVCYLKNDNGSFDILTNELKPWQAAKAILILETDEVKKLDDKNFITYFSRDNGRTTVSNSLTLQSLYVEKMFSKDTVLLDKLNVFAWGSSVPDKVNEKLKKELFRANASFHRQINKAVEKEAFNFTDNSHGTRFLSLKETKGKLDYAHDEEKFRNNERDLLSRVKSETTEQISKQIAILIDYDVKKFTLNSQSMDQFLIDNRKTISEYVQDKDKLNNIFKIGNESNIEVIQHNVGKKRKNNASRSGVNK